MISAAAAMIIANSPAAPIYAAALHQNIGPLSLQHWINDGLMAVFFLLVGLEIKRELLDGRLRRWSDRVLPSAAAIGGMAAPALIYAVVNRQSPSTINGWAIPAATDIAFALGVLALLGRRVPVSLKVFLMALAILDDLGAIVVIALFYTNGVSLIALASAAAISAGLYALNRAGVGQLWAYLALGIVLWIFVFMSGVHATIAGVLVAFAIPLRLSVGKPDDPTSPLHCLEHAIQPWVAFVVLPVFGFANAGVSVIGFDMGKVFAPVPLGVALGLFLGKQMGVFGTLAIAVRLGWAKRPSRATWMQIYGVSVLCGVGFTISLFIGLLAFSGRPDLEVEMKIGVLSGSILSMIGGVLILRFAPQRPLLKGSGNRKCEGDPMGRHAK